MSTATISNLSESFSLSGKRILITGASRGLGSVCAQAFAAQGARLILTARSEADLTAVRESCAEPERHQQHALDLTDFDRLQNVIGDILSDPTPLDVVLHVAGGGLGLRDPLIGAADLQKLLSLNLMAAAEINRLVAPAMVARGRGNLVHVGSVSGSQANASVGYNTAKAALAAYVRSLGNHLAGTGVVATGILPGGFMAPGNSWARLTAVKPEVVETFVAERLPRKRLAEAEELVGLLSFLCSDAASMMAGCMVPIDAGEGQTYI